MRATECQIGGLVRYERMLYFVVRVFLQATIPLLAKDMRHLQPEAFRVFVGHPRLKRATIGLGSDRKNRSVAAMLGLPSAEQRTEFQFQ